MQELRDQTDRREVRHWNLLFDCDDILPNKEMKTRTENTLAYDTADYRTTPKYVFRLENTLAIIIEGISVE